MAKITGVKSHTSTSSAFTKNDVDTFYQSMPPGIIVLLTQNTVPPGWLLCDGSEYSQQTYANLFQTIGDVYNGHPTKGDAALGKFRVPDFVNIFPLSVSPGYQGTYNVNTGWSHTHTIPAHAHTLNNHTHEFSNHTHTIPAHVHSLNNHTHTIPSHSHTISSHVHDVPAHKHSHTIAVKIVHYHNINCHSGTSTGQTDVPRAGSGSSSTDAYKTSSSDILTIDNVTGTVGAGTYADTGSLDTNSSGPGTGNSSGSALANSDSSGTSTATNSGNPTGSSGQPSSNTTSTDGLSTTDAITDGNSVNPPYFGVHFIIKT